MVYKFVAMVKFYQASKRLNQVAVVHKDSEATIQKYLDLGWWLVDDHDKYFCSQVDAVNRLTGTTEEGDWGLKGDIEITCKLSQAYNHLLTDKVIN